MWLIVTMVVVSAVGAVMVSMYGTATWSRIGGAGIAEARWMAESGRRFFLKEYEGLTTEADKNQLIDGPQGLHGKTFEMGPSDRSRFRLDFTSWYYRIETNPSGGTTLRLQMPGDGGFDPSALPAPGLLWVHGEDEFHTPNASPASDGDTYVFTVSPSVPSTDIYSTVYPVVESDIAADVAEGGTLSLESGMGEAFPLRNGIFGVEEIKDEIELGEIRRFLYYRYAYRDGDDLVSVTAYDPTNFVVIEAGTDKRIVVDKFLFLESVGEYGGDASHNASYYILDHSLPKDPTDWNGGGGLELYLPGEISGGIPDDPLGNPMTLEGSSPPTTTTGRVGSALSFGGSGYISTVFNPSDSIGTGQPFSVVFWAKPDASILNDLLSVVIGADDFDATNRKRFYIGITYGDDSGETTGEWIWGFGDQHGRMYDGSNDLPDASPYWQHVAYVFDGSTVLLYINGVKKYSHTYTGSGQLPDLSIDIGSRRESASSSNFPFTGEIDELAVFDRALTVCEVRAIYNVPCNLGCGEFFSSESPDVDPVLFYPFNGNSLDESGNDKDGNPPNDNPGTVHGATLSEDRFGCTDKAFSFSVNDYIDGGNKSDLTITDAITVSAWIRYDSGSGHIVNRGGGWDDSGYSLFWLSGNIRIELQDTTRSEKRIFDSNASSLNDGGWHHVVFTWSRYDGVDPESGLILTYFDGVRTAQSLVDSTPTDNPNYFQGPIGTPPENLNVGRKQQNSYYFNGKIDEVLVWDFQFTEEQVQRLYELTQNPSP